MARQLHEMGAGWLLFTVMHGTKYLCSPNATYDKILGTTPGEACSERDLPMALYEALKKYDIDLYLYYTGDGPWREEEYGPKMGFHDRFKEAPVPEKFLKNWLSVLSEYAERYKGKVKGWWMDGFYEYFGYTNENMKRYQDVLKKADPNYLVSYNDGWAVDEARRLNEWRYDKTSEAQELQVNVHRWFVEEDYTASEMLDFTIYPTEECDIQWHALSPLSGNGSEACAWGEDGVKYTEAYFADYLKKVWAKGGVVTVDMGMCRSGKFFNAQKAFMKKVMRQ